jgi:hypothetical protein
MNIYEKEIYRKIRDIYQEIIMIILVIQLLSPLTGEGNKTDQQPMIYDPP